MLKLSDRFYRALCLCAGERSIKLRLADAWIKYLDEVSAARLPDRAKKLFSDLHRTMYDSQPMPKEHPARAAVRKMSARQATAHARTIARIYKELLKEEFTRPAQTDSLPAVEVAELSPDPEHDHQLN